MSKYLIIFANPSHAGHGGYILSQIKEKLEHNNHSYSIIDLYQEEYNPILKSEELKKGDDRTVSPDTLIYQEKIRIADKIIFIYPVWWQNMPAILKGFLDRTLTSGFAFKYNLGLPRPLLYEKKAAVFCTTASPRFYNYIFKNNLAANILSQDVLKYCGIKSKNFNFARARHLEHNKLRLEKMADSIIAYLK